MLMLLCLLGTGKKGWRGRDEVTGEQSGSARAEMRNGHDEEHVDFYNPFP